MSELISRSRALQVARKKLPFMSEAKIEANMEMACLTVAEAFKCGAEEAQYEIVNRLLGLPTVEKPKQASEG